MLGCASWVRAGSFCILFRVYGVWSEDFFPVVGGGAEQWWGDGLFSSLGISGIKREHGNGRQVSGALGRGAPWTVGSLDGGLPGKIWTESNWGNA